MYTCNLCGCCFLFHGYDMSTSGDVVSAASDTFITAAFDATAAAAGDIIIMIITVK